MNETGKNKPAIKSDLIVIGAGGSGLSAAVAAASRGVKVRVIDKRHTAGGTMNLLAGLVAADSPTQKREGINISSDDLFLKHMQYSCWTLNPRIVRTWLDRTGETIRWLEEKGVKFQMFSMFTDELPTSWHWGLRVGSDIVKVLLQECRNLNVQFSFETRATRILLDKSGKVAGLAAQAGDKNIKFETKAIIIATGGYGGTERCLQSTVLTIIIPCHPPELKYPTPGMAFRWLLKPGQVMKGWGTC